MATGETTINDKHMPVTKSNAGDERNPVAGPASASVSR